MRGIGWLSKFKFNSPILLNRITIEPLRETVAMSTERMMKNNKYWALTMCQACQAHLTHLIVPDVLVERFLNHNATLLTNSSLLALQSSEQDIVANSTTIGVKKPELSFQVRKQTKRCSRSQLVSNGAKFKSRQSECRTLTRNHCNYTASQWSHSLLSNQFRKPSQDVWNFWDY